MTALIVTSSWMKRTDRLPCPKLKSVYHRQGTQLHQPLKHSGTADVSKFDAARITSGNSFSKEIIQ
jgi:hypothetical protein